MPMPSLTQLLQEYRREPGAQAGGLWAFLRRRDPWVFAHHPPQETFRSHVWAFRGLYFCKGCVMTWVGAALGLAAHALLFFFPGFRFGATWPWWWCALVCVGLALPTLVSSVTETPGWTRHLARLLLGLLVATALAYLVFAPLDRVGFAGRAAVVAAYFAIKVPLVRRRERLNQTAAAAASGPTLVHPPLRRPFRQRKKDR